MKWTKLIKAERQTFSFLIKSEDHELVDNIEVVYLDEDLTKAQLEVSVRNFENGQIKSSRSWLINNDKIKQAEQLVANFQKKWSTYLFDSAGSKYLTDQVWNDITAIREQVCVDNKKSSSSLSVLPKLLDKVWYDYDEEDIGKYAQIGFWEIGLGGYDTGYEVSYNGTPIFSITEYNELKPFMSDDMLQDEFGFSYNDIEKTLKKHRDLKNIKMVNASKKHDFYIKEDFPAFDGDIRVAVIEEDENGEYFDWNYFDTYEEAEEFLKEMKGELKNKSASKKIKSFNLKDAITKIQDRYHELMDIGSWSDAEWFKKGEYAYIYIPVNKFDFRKNVTTGETDKEAVKALEELSGQKVEIIKIKATIKGPYDVMTADAKPTLVDVRFEDGQVWEDVNTEWLKHKPFGEDEDNKQIEAQIEDNRHMVERISDLLDSGFEQEEIINIVCNEFECEPQEVEQFLRKVTYASKVVSEREAGKDLNLAIRKANKVLKEEIYRWDIGRRDVAKSVAKNFEEITGININQLFTKVDDKYGSVIENVNAKLFDKQMPKIYKWVKNNFKIDKYDYETMQQDSDFIDMITDELVDMVDIDKVEYDKR